MSVLTLILCLVALSACSNTNNNSSSDNKDSWLEGKWYSKSWDTTYVFSNNKGSWKIKDEKGNFISKEATKSKDSIDKELTLVDKDGTQFVINKIDNSHINFHQVSKEGLLGTTATVEFVKK